MNAGLDAARTALAGQRAWLVGGAVRDRVLGRSTSDVDIVVEGDSARAARAVARAARASGDVACFALSEEFGAWRVLARDRSWQVDVEPLRADSLKADLALRDFTVNAIAEPLAGGALIDPLGGLADLDARRLRVAGPGAFSDDPLRVLRLVRVAVELGLEPEHTTLQGARESAAELARSAGERVFIELRRIIAAEHVVQGLELMREVGAMAAVLPELDALRGVEQSHYHHRDVYGHTLEVLAQAISLERAAFGVQVDADGEDVGEQQWTLRAHREGVASVLSEGLADDLTRAGALRWGALLHDIAKPPTRGERPDGRVTFIGHDSVGADLAREVLARLRASEKLRAHVAGLVRHHLVLGFLVHEAQPLAARTMFAYLRRVEPLEVDVTLLSVADRLATRGERAAEAIDAHLRLAREVLGKALRWRAAGAPRALLRGDELARELGIGVGPRVGELLEELAAAQYAGDVTTRAQALAFAHAHARDQRQSE